MAVHWVRAWYQVVSRVESPIQRSTHDGSSAPVTNCSSSDEAMDTRSPPSCTQSRLAPTQFLRTSAFSL
ncbi:hypothetical protein EYF80_036417 [Liparis tanakae]|uniref:Uncharacterized protein n=1 Tax=Liparis tanakae TaxID=230148 RepID=A0A4Z2GJE5_9TELE|nr:hypothetical protein EYF80_036417 [Liparis tanakae]